MKSAKGHGREEQDWVLGREIPVLCSTMGKEGVGNAEGRAKRKAGALN